MGCAQSKIDNEESVSRCKERRNIMKEALIARNAFAAGHSGYTTALKNTGAALSDYAHGEAEIQETLQGNDVKSVKISTQGTSTQTHMETLPPPPPPLPNFSPSPLKRATTMPAFGTGKKDVRDNQDVGTIVEDAEEVGGEDGDGGGGLRQRTRRNKRNSGKEVRGNEKSVIPSPPMTPPITPVRPPPPDLKGVAWDYFFMVDNMPGPSLNELEEVEVGKEDIESNDFGGRQNGNGNRGFVGVENVSGNSGFVGRENVNGNGGMGEEIDEFEFKTPEKVAEKEGNEQEEDNSGKKVFVHSSTAPPEFKRGGKGVSSINLLKLLEAVDDHFLKASESAQEVSKMLEANRLHYHSNFADNSGNCPLLLLRY